jgi:hypothetical protein
VQARGGLLGAQGRRLTIVWIEITAAAYAALKVAKARGGRVLKRLEAGVAWQTATEFQRQLKARSGRVPATMPSTVITMRPIGPHVSIAGSSTRRQAPFSSSS